MPVDASMLERQLNGRVGTKLSQPQPRRYYVTTHPRLSPPSPLTGHAQLRNNQVSIKKRSRSASLSKRLAHAERVPSHPHLERYELQKNQGQAVIPPITPSPTRPHGSPHVRSLPKHAQASVYSCDGSESRTSIGTCSMRFDYQELPIPAESNVKGRWERMVRKVGNRVVKVTAKFYR